MLCLEVLVAICQRGRLWWACPALPEKESKFMWERTVSGSLEKRKRREQDGILVWRQGGEREVLERRTCLKFTSRDRDPQERENKKNDLPQR